MEFLRVSNWDKWQTYRSDRGKPPWIKVHKELQQNWEWVDLPDHQRGQLVAIWLLASSREGVIPASPRKVQKLCNMSELPDLQALVSLGFLEGDVIEASDGSQDDVPDKIREVKLSKVKLSKETPLSGKPNESIVISYLNEKTGSNYQPVESNLKLIRARFKEGRTPDELCDVIDRQVLLWKDDLKMQKYLRPATLFNAEKFNSYFGQLGQEIDRGNGNGQKDTRSRAQQVNDELDRLAKEAIENGEIV